MTNNKRYSPLYLLTYFFLIIYVFCLIYAPRFYSFNTLHILTGISILVIPFLLNNFILILKKSITLKFCLFYFFIVFYSTLIAYFGGERLTLTNLIVVPVELCLCILFVLSLTKWIRLNSLDVINIIIIAGIIQSLICCLMVFIPDVRNIINEFRAQFWDDRLIGWSKVRLLGFADGLFHTTPIIQAIISVLLIKKSEKNPILYIFVITTLLSALLNSRTSFIIWALCLMVYLFSTSSNRNKKRNVIIFGVLAIFIPTVIFAMLDENAKEAIDYFYAGMKEINDASQGKKTGFFELISQYLIFPNNLDFLFGIGCDTYGTINNAEYRKIHTDYGFVNDIWMYGFVGAFLMVVLYLKLIFNCSKLQNDYAKLIKWCFLISFVIGHFKGIITYYNDFTSILLLVSSSTVLDKYCTNRIYIDKVKISSKIEIVS